MAPPLYPTRDLDNPPVLKTHLGSFWSEIYADQPELDASLEALALAWRQIAQDVDATIDDLAYETMPYLANQEWLGLTIRESDRRKIEAAGLRYAENTTAKYGGQYTYGEITTLDRVPVFVGDVVEVAAIFDRPAATKVSLTAEVDFTIDSRGILWFVADLFRDPRWNATPIYDEHGVQVDRELTIWLWRSRRDVKKLYRRLGYVFNLDPPASAQGRDVLNNLVDSLTQGTSQYSLERFLALLFDIPLCRTDGETVDVVFRDARGLQIVTDKSVYCFSARATPIVAAGDVLREHQPLVADLQIHSLNTGRTPAGLSALSLGADLLDPTLPGAVTFTNQLVPVTVIPTNPPQVRWPLFATAATETAFWTSVHARGVESGKVLANYLDRRPIPIGQPTAASLPRQINPLEFLLQNLLRGSTVLVRANAAGFGPNALNPTYLRLLRKITPPHVLLILQITLPGITDLMPEDPADSFPPPEETLSLIYDPSPSVALIDDMRYTITPMPGIHL